MNKQPLAVITGASSGIGAEFARQLAARGFRLLLIARREDRLWQLAQDLAKSRGPARDSGEMPFAEVEVADLSRESDRARVAARIAQAPDLALLVNNAGFGTQGLFEDADMASQDQMHQVHILATLDLTHAALRNFKTQQNGTTKRGIINVSSVAAFQQAPFNVTYCASKTWINSFTTGLATELAAEPSAEAARSRMARASSSRRSVRATRIPNFTICWAWIVARFRNSCGAPPTSLCQNPYADSTAAN